MCLQAGGCPTAQSENQNAGSGFVEPVYRVDMLANLVAQHLNGKAGFVTVDRAAVYQQAGRFIDGDVMRITIYNSQFHGAHDTTETEEKNARC